MIIDDKRYKGIAKSSNRTDHLERCQITIQSSELLTSDGLHGRSEAAALHHENTADNLRAAVWSTRAIRTGPVTALENSVGGRKLQDGQ